MTLGILAIVTLLVIAFATSMRVENMASKNFNDLIKARDLANFAVDHAAATIRQATPPRTQTPLSTYVTFPGVIYNYNGTLPATRVPLYTVNASDPLDLNDTANNVFWITKTNGEFTVAANSQINVGWIYVGQNPTIVPGPANPIVGRYAFWVDDEASKININTAGNAWSTTDPYGASDPLAVDLQQLLNVPPPSVYPYNYAADVASGGLTYPRATYPYATIEEARRANASITDPQFTANQFSTTVYSDDASGGSVELDAQGVPRRVLSQLTENDDIKNTPAASSNAFARLSNLNTTLHSVYSSAGTFETKYTQNGLKQIIANIIAYQIDPTATWPPDDGSLPPVYLGLAKTPYINEVQVKYELAGTSPNVTVTRTVSAELFYMYDSSYTPAVAAGDETITVSGLPDLGVGFSPSVTLNVSGTFDNANRYRVFTASDAPVSLASLATTPSALTQVTYNRKYGGAPKRLDYAEMNLLQVTLDPAGSPTILYQDAEANDPAVNDTDGLWAKTTTSGTLVTPYQNSAYNPPSEPGLPAKSLPSKAIMRATQIMQSIGELGYIHTPNSWQYLKLQPNGGGGAIPDWAVLDMFTVGAAVPNVTSGRININSFINPDPTPAVRAPVTPRLVPLEALLNTVISPPLTVAGHIYEDDTTIRTDTYGMKDSFGNGIFDTIGELCEVPSLANSATTEAGKEAVIRRIANLITVRSNTFTIWVIAQSIKEPNVGALQTFGTFQPTVDLITGEVRAQAVVERYENPIGTGPFFRTKYFRYIYQ